MKLERMRIRYADDPAVMELIDAVEKGSAFRMAVISATDGNAWVYDDTKRETPAAHASVAFVEALVVVLRREPTL